MAAKVRLPGKRFFTLKGNEVELAVGLLLAAVLEAQPAEATVTRDGLPPLEPTPAHADDGAANQQAPQTLEQMLGIAPDAVKTVTIEELKAHLTPAVLASLGLDDHFLELLDHDRKAAIRSLEAAYRKKIAAMSGGDSGHSVAQADTGDGHGHAHGSSEGGADLDSFFAFAGHAISPLLLIAGAAAIGGGIYLATKGDDDHKDHAPTAVNDTFTTNEDTPTTFDVRTNDTDPDHDTLTVTQINGTNITTTSPVTITGGVISLGADGKLTFTPTANYNGSPSFTYTISDGRGGTSTATVSGTVAAVNDAPVNTVPTSVSEAAGAHVTISGLAISDVDGSAGSYSTTLSVSAGTITVGQVAGGATVTINPAGAVVLTGTLDQINASLKAVDYVSTGGAGTATLTVDTSDGQLHDVDTVSIVVSQAVTGVAQDGYLSGAKVFIDVNGDGKYEDGEPTATTDANGNFAFTTTAAGNIMVIGGVNTDTGLANTLTLSAPLGATVVNPLSTLVAQMMQSGASLADAKAMVAEALHLPAGTDVTNLDFLSPHTDPALALAAQKMAVEVATVLTLAGSMASPENAAAVQAAALKSLAATLADAAAHGTTVDLTDSSTIHSIMDGANTILAAAHAADPNVADLSLSTSQVDALAIHSAAVNQAVDHATSATDIASSINKLLPADAVLPPLANTDHYTLDEDGHLTFNPLDNDVSPTGGLLTITQIGDIKVDSGTVVGVDGGTITVGDNGQLTFTPNADYHGTPSFDYTVIDSSTGLTTVGTVDLTVNSVNDAPVTHPDFATTSVDTPVTIDVLANDSDADGDHLTVTSIDGQILTSDHPVTVDGGTIGLGPNGVLVFTPNDGYAGIQHFDYTVSDGNGGTGTGGVDVTVSAPGGVLPFNPADLANIVSHADQLAAAGVTTLDSIGGSVTIDDVQAHSLVTAGLHFADADDVSLTPASGEGTHLSSTLKDLQSLHIDTVKVDAGTPVLNLEAGSSLADISATALPHFVSSDGSTPNVVLDVSGGTLATTADLGTIATNLAAAGIDHIHADAPITIDFAQAEALHTAGIDFTTDSDVTMTFSDADQFALSDLIALHVDHLDFTGAELDLTTAEAAAAIAAGIDFAVDDNVVVHADGTHISTTLKGLADLHVDTVKVDAGTPVLNLDAGTTLAGLATETLPHFVIDPASLAAGATAPNLDVTVNVAGGTLDPTLDLGSVATELHNAGVEHIGISGDGHMALSGDQALTLADAGLSFSQASDITLNIEASQVGLITSDAHGAADFGVDHLNVDGAVSITDADASALIAAGIDFAADDTVSVHASGTHLNSSLHDLQALHVDTIAVDAGVTTLHVDAGDLATLSASGLPQFDVEQSDAALNVTLHVSASQLTYLDGTLGTSLRDAGVDHFGLDQPIDTYDAATQAELAKITADTGINFVYDPEKSPILAYSATDTDTTAVSGDMDHSLVQQLIEAFDHAEDHGAGGHVVVQDDVIPALAESGALRAYTADTLVVDGTHTGGDQLLTSLKDIASLGVDKVMVTGDASSTTYVDIGTFSQLSGDEVTQMKQLFATLNETVPANTSIFSGTSGQVGLVVSEDVAHAISQVDGATEKLASMGFTQLDVLMNSGSTTAPITSSAVEVKLIGQDEDLYKHLHHDQ